MLPWIVISSPSLSSNRVAPSRLTQAELRLSRGFLKVINVETGIITGRNERECGASGVTQILNKPTLATVATTGSYNDLINLPTIPAAQVNSDWNATSGLARILNKPTIFSGNYSDLSGRPSIPATITDLADVNLPNPIPNGAYLRWDSSTVRWVTGASAGIGNIVEDTTPQLGATLDLNGHDITGGTSSTIEVSGDTSKIKFLYQNLSDLPSASSWHGMFAHVHAQGHGYFAHGGAWLQLLDEGSSIGDLAGVDLSTPPSTGQVLKYDGNNWVAGPDNAGSGGTGIALTDISVTSATAGTASLSYNNVSGVFTYTPPDVSNFLTSFTETDPVYSASPAAGILSSNISNWDTAYGWGNHASAGYLTSETSHSDVVVDGDFASTGLMKRGASSGTYSTITDNSNNWNTSYGWGNHASAGYLTSYTVTGSDLNNLGVGNLADVTTSGASVNDVLKWNGSNWAPAADATGGGGGANVTISDTAPGGASTGDLWWESDKGRLKIYYQDTDTTQWVDASPPLAPALSSNAPATASSAGSEGDIRFDSGYVYVCIATNTWKRAALTTW